MPTLQEPTPSDLQTQFCQVLPRIQTHAHIYFRNLRCIDSREDSIAEAVALAWRWYCRLIHRGKNVNEFISALASFACRAVTSGRRLGGSEKIRDFMASTQFKRTSITPETLTCLSLQEALHDNRHTPPAEQAAFRIDFPAWWETLDTRRQQIASRLMNGERTFDVAQEFKVSSARISQLRLELRQDWQQFQET